jgi:hypothetical protein
MIPPPWTQRQRRTHLRLPQRELRHVWVSLLHDAGFSLEKIAAFAGHGSAWMTWRAPAKTASLIGKARR